MKGRESARPGAPPRPPAPGPRGAPGGGPRAGFIRTRSAQLSIRWIATLAVAALTTAAVLSVGAVAERSARRVLTREIETRLVLQARNLGLTSTEALLADFPELALHPLAKEMKAKQPELALVLVLDHAGKIQGDPDARRLGTVHAPAASLRAVPAPPPLGSGEELLTDGRLLVASAAVTHRDGRRIGTAMVGLERDYVERAIVSARRQQTMVLGLVLLVGIAGAFVLMSFLLRPVEALRAGIERIGRGDLDTPLKLRDRTELGLLADAVNDMAAELKQAQSEMVERERLAHEVELARQIQNSLLPNRRAVAGSFVIEGSQRAAAEVGGDYYDYFPLPGDKIGIAVADVAGKGLAGCLVMSMLSALLRAYRESHPSPTSLLCALDAHLGETLQSGSFVTMFYGILDPATGEVAYASAGHSPLLVYRRAVDKVEWLRTRGIPLGAVRGGAIRRTLEDAVLRLDPGDVLVQFTDGINEAFDPRGREQFGFERMERVVGRNAERGCQAVIAGLHRAVEEWTGDGPPIDDETVLVVCCEGDPAGDGAPVAAAATAPAGVGPPGRPAGPERLLAEARDRGRCLRMPASLDALPGIRPWLVENLPDNLLRNNEFELLSTSLYEACANIVEHGCGQDPARQFELWWVPGAGADPGCGNGRGLGHFLIRDQGIPFRADNWRETDFSDPRVRRRGRGFGLDIIHRAMSRVAYHPGTAEGNLTLMTFSPAHDGERREELGHV